MSRWLLQDPALFLSWSSCRSCSNGHTNFYRWLMFVVANRGINWVYGAWNWRHWLSRRGPPSHIREGHGWESRYDFVLSPIIQVVGRFCAFCWTWSSTITRLSFPVPSNFFSITLVRDKKFSAPSSRWKGCDLSVGYCFSKLPQIFDSVQYYVTR